MTELYQIITGSLHKTVM